MEKGSSIDASLDEWEFLPDHKSFFFMESSTGHGHNIGGKDQLLFGTKLVMINMNYFDPTTHPSPYDYIPDQETKKVLPPVDDGVHEPVKGFKDIGVVPPPVTGSNQEESMPKVATMGGTELDPLVSDGEEGEEMFKAAAKEVDQDKVVVVQVTGECGEGEMKKGKPGLDCTGFSVGKWRVNGTGALCSFGVAAATICIFLLGGRQQQQHQRQQQSQIYADDNKRIEQVVQQASRLNQAMSSVIGGPATRASISFGGYYDGL